MGDIGDAGKTRDLNQMVWIGVDVGGTKIDGVLVDRDARVLAEWNDATAADQGAEAVMDRIAGVIRWLMTAAGKQRIGGIGIGCPGQVNPRDGMVRGAVNLGWVNVPLKAGLEARLFGIGVEKTADDSVEGKTRPLGFTTSSTIVPIHLGNDVNTIALGEYRFGVGQESRSLVYLAIGTGLGGGAVVDGNLITGDNDFAMEVGHLSLRPEGRRCGCGMYGCPESYLSGTGLMSGIQTYMHEFRGSILSKEATVTTPMILRAARALDPLALKVIDEAGEMLGIVMGMCAMVLNPDLFVIGGGLGKAAADLLLPRAEKVFHARSLYPSSEKVTVKMAGVERAAVGAASLAM